MPRIFGIAGWSGSGKTTLIEAMMPHLRTLGLVVGVMKHTHHQLAVDLPAAAAQALVLGQGGWRLTGRCDHPGVHDLLSHYRAADLVLVEGWKSAPIPKLEVHRPALGKSMLAERDPFVVAVASDVAFPVLHVPRLDLNDARAAAELAVARAVILDENPMGQNAY